VEPTDGPRAHDAHRSSLWSSSLEVSRPSLNDIDYFPDGFDHMHLAAPAAVENNLFGRQFPLARWFFGVLYFENEGPISIAYANIRKSIADYRSAVNRNPVNFPKGRNNLGVIVVDPGPHIILTNPWSIRRTRVRCWARRM